MTNTKTTTNETASQAYANRRGDIARLMDVVEMELDTHATRAANDEKNWGYAGDLGGIRNSLIEMVSQMSQMSRVQVETFLEDANDADAN
jgi:hypothetical protein